MLTDGGGCGWVEISAIWINRWWVKSLFHMKTAWDLDDNSFYHLLVGEQSYSFFVVSCDVSLLWAASSAGLSLDCLT